MIRKTCDSGNAYVVVAVATADDKNDAVVASTLSVFEEKPLNNVWVSCLTKYKEMQKQNQ